MNSLIWDSFWCYFVSVLFKSPCPSLPSLDKHVNSKRSHDALALTEQRYRGDDDGDGLMVMVMAMVIMIW